MPDTAAWRALDRSHVWHPYTQMHTAPEPLAIENAAGAYLYTADGRALLDGTSSWWVTLHGHNVPRLNAALAAQAERMAHVMFAGCTHEPGARLAAALAQRVGLPRVFYSDNGSTAVEVALKMAYQACRNRGEPQRTLFVAFDGAYHGDTFGAMAASGTQLFHGVFADLLFTVRRAHGPQCPRAGGAPCAADCPDSLATIVATLGQRIAAVIIEPMVQGAGGMIMWSAAQLRAVQAACKEHGIVLIADEVFTGFGRTGTFLASEHAPIKADLVCLSKALTAGYLPLGATLASAAIYDAFLSDDRSRTFFHGHSFTGNPLACAVALASLHMFDDTDVLGRVARLQALYEHELRRLATLPGVRQTRHIGAIAVVELQGGSHGYLETRGATVAAALLHQHILLRPLGNVLYLLPPMCITDAEVRHVFAQMGAILAAPARAPRGERRLTRWQSPSST